MILTDKEEINSENKDFIEDLKELSAQGGECFIIFDKKDVTLKINIDEVKMKIPKQEFCSKVDVKINDRIDLVDIFWMLIHIPNHLAIRLEADYFDKIIELMRSKILIVKMKEQWIKFLHKGIKIEPLIIYHKMKVDSLKNKVKEIEAKRCRMSMDCDK